MMTDSYSSLDEIEKELMHCKECPRLVAWREQVGREKRRAYRDEDYWARPVPGFGDPQARILIVGLAPGAHGSNRTGRMFSGDDSGKFLYPALYRAGFASQPDGLRVGDGLKLQDIWITAVCRCVPPDNKPNRTEMGSCRHWLEAEMRLLPKLRGVVALGRIAWDEMIRNLDPGQNGKVCAFSHGCFTPGEEGKLWMLGSYHPSRQNTQTGRLTASVFDEIWDQVNLLLMD